jgi:NADPH:quinone reductase-like Zn-dependent oxidoreductase
MRAVGVYEYGGPEKLTLVTLPVPEPGPGQLLVRVHAATVNPTDVSMCAGAQAGLQRDLPAPYVPGMELAGVVEAAGAGAAFAPGERVAAIASPVIRTGGAHAEYVLVAEASAARIPDGMPDELAATVPMNGLTVELALDLLDLRAGRILGVTGSAGVVGTYAITLGRRRGLRVIAECGAKDRDLVLGLGAASHVQRGPDWAARMMAEAGGQVDGLLDAAVIGAPVLAVVRDGGVVAAVRAFDGQPERGIRVVPVGVRAYLGRGDLIAQLLQLAASGELPVRVARTFAPDEMAGAHRMLAAGGVRGRLVVDWR